MSSKSRRALVGVCFAAVTSAALIAQGRGPVIPGPSPTPPQPLRRLTQPAAAAGHLTTPKEQWGHNVGDDYFLADYQQLLAYWRKLEKESNRIHLVEIGK